MSRIFKSTAIVAVVLAACCGAALASVKKVTGGSTQISVSNQVVTRLAANQLSLVPLAGSTASGPTFSFAISRGHLNTKNLHGKIHQTGGLAILKGHRQVRMRRLSLVSDRRGVSLFALVRARPRTVCFGAPFRHLHPHCVFAAHAFRARIGRVTGTTVSAGTATGTLRLTEFSAAVVNGLAGTRIARAGAAIGTITVTPQLG